MDDMKAQPCANTRFVPASQLDFSRYAKNLAWLLDLKLQQAQELLSRIYGYEHLHELQQAMKSGLQPGPFWDDEPAEGETQSGLSLLEGMPGERSMRPAKVLLDWKREHGRHPWLQDNEAFIVELGLTDSPASHRDCVRRVKGYLEQKYSVDVHGYPTGFWSFLAGYKFESSQEEQKTVRDLLEATGTGWFWGSEGPATCEDQTACTAMSRAVDVLGELGKLIDHEIVDWGFGFEDDDLGWDSMWKVLSRQDEWGDRWQEACAESVFGLEDGEGDEDPKEEERFEDLCRFVEWPTEERLKQCGVDMSFQEASGRVSRWRLGWLMAAVNQWQSSANRIVKLSGWTSARSESGQWVQDADFVSLVMKERRQYDYEDSISLMDVMGTLIIEGPEGGRQVGGMVQGWHFSPVKEYYAGFEQVDEFLEDHREVQQGWEVARQYMAMRGITDMKHWVNSDEGCGMTVLNMKLAPGFDNDETRARFITLIAECFDEEGGPYTQSDDAYFGGEELPGMEEFYMRTGDLMIRTPGLIVVSVSGLHGIGFSIAEEDGEGRQIMVIGGGRTGESRAERRMYGRMGQRADDALKAKMSRARKLLEKVVDAAIDVAVLDLGARDGEDD